MARAAAELRPTIDNPRRNIRAVRPVTFPSSFMLRLCSLSPSVNISLMCGCVGAVGSGKCRLFTRQGWAEVDSAIASMDYRGRKGSFSPASDRKKKKVKVKRLSSPSFIFSCPCSFDLLSSAIDLFPHLLPAFAVGTLSAMPCKEKPRLFFFAPLPV